MSDLPENIDLRWIGLKLLSLETDVRDLKTDVRHLRDDLDVVVMRAIRIDNTLTSLRDEMRALTSRVHALEQGG
ncbi:hypothetical protein DFR50_13931 [Roseiarcus fermentans]|uniref:Uncharacterized protein n=1 Tax=Roseiarcus fermentans TaxID=1473586 RepID=A0A366EQI4_9HYPH|nr:hypothetical protein DFR50_13931 [Roseiarcus fermentans]